jgi:hypothetical protein
MLLGRDQIVTGRDLENAIEERTYLMAREGDGLIEGSGIPPCRHAGGEQRLHF